MHSHTMTLRFAMISSKSRYEITFSLVSHGK
nr:MAG TPA_asm: hypothetical protein [Caudoviricetes sp.]